MAKTEQIIIENFQDMRTDIPQYSAKNTNYLMSGVDPLYYVSLNTIQEEQLAPLAASFANNMVTDANGTITDIISVPEGALSLPGFALADSAGYVTIGSLTSQVLGSATGQIQNLVDFSGFLVVMSSAYTTIGFKLYSAGSWTIISTSITLTGGAIYMTSFLNFCLICNGNFVYKLLQGVSALIAPSTTAVLNIGSGWSILGKPVVYGNYVSIAGSRIVGTTNTYSDNYLFLWNGYGSTYQYSIKLPGKYVGQANINGTLYVVVETKLNTQAVYYVYNQSLRRVKALPNLYTTAGVGGTKTNPVFEARGYLAICTDYGLLLYRKDETIGDVSYLLNNGSYNFGCSAGVNNSIYTVNGANYYNDNLLGGSGTNPINYLSQYIPVTPSKIEIWYDQPPQSGTDAINVTLYGINQYNAQGQLYNETISLASITPSVIASDNSNSKKFTLDCAGFMGEKVRVQLQTVNTGSWQPIIRKIAITPRPIIET